jgi:hypothetical protein
MTPAMLAALQAKQINPAIFVEAHFNTTIAYMWTGVGPITWSGQTWLGVGTFGSVSTIEEASTVEAKGVTLTLSGINAALLADALQELGIGLPVLIYFGLFDSGGALIPDPIVSFAGRMDQPTIDVGGDTATISVNCESRLMELSVACERRYTQSDQHIEYPSDDGFNFVNSVSEITIYWGRTPSASQNV